MATTIDPNDPKLKQVRPDGQQENYLVLSEEERQKGFVRPVRTSYIHVGKRPTYPTRPLTPEEQERYQQCSYVCFEEYPKNETIVGKFWTQEQINSGCGAVTKMGEALAETYARDPSFYGGTFCVQCQSHFPVGEQGEFIWLDGSRVGT